MAVQRGDDPLIGPPKIHWLFGGRRKMDPNLAHRLGDCGLGFGCMVLSFFGFADASMGHILGWGGFLLLILRLPGAIRDFRANRPWRRRSR